MHHHLTVLGSGDRPTVAGGMYNDRIVLRTSDQGTQTPDEPKVVAGHRAFEVEIAPLQGRTRVHDPDPTGSVCAVKLDDAQSAAVVDIRMPSFDRTTVGAKTKLESYAVLSDSSSR